MVNVEIYFNSPHAWQELFRRFKTDTSWNWRGGDSDILGFHLDGKDSEGNELRLCDIRSAQNLSTPPPNFLLDICAKDDAAAEVIGSKFLELAEATDPDWSAIRGPDPVKVRKLRLWPLIFFFACSAVILYWSGVEIHNELQLKNNSETVLAPVDDFYTTEGGEYLVQYHFVVDGQTYTNRDATGRIHLIVEVLEDEWQDARDYGTIPIHYIKENPWINAPIGVPNDPMQDHIAGLALGLTLSLLPIIGSIVERHRILQARPSPFVRHKNRLGIKYLFWKV